jgi:hypothetical protein
MLMALCMLSCSTDDITTPSGRKGPRLAFNVSTSNGKATRMSELITQRSGNYRDIQDLRLIPFGSQVITSDMHPLSEPLTQMTQYEDEAHPEFIYYYDNGSQEIPDGTSSFLCYCKAQPTAGYEGGFKNGSLTTTLDGVSIDWNDENTKASDIKFNPVSIYTETKTVGTESQVKTDTKATAIATYLTSIANAHPAGEETNTWSSFSQSDAQGFSSDLTALRSLFRQFVNEGHPIAGSSVYVEKWVNWLYAQLQSLNPEANSNAANIKNAILAAIANTEDYVTVTDDYVVLKTDYKGYPANITLPEGAAVVQWNAKTKVFTPQVESSTTANVNSLNRFVYPPELYYYANSGIKTSPENLFEELNKSTWEAVLARFDQGLGTVDGSVNSIAINDPLAYAVGNLQLGFYVPSTTLSDAKGTAVPLTSGTGDDVVSHFPLTSLLVSSQHPQDYKFEPVDGTSDEYIVYDKEDIPAIKLGSAKEQTPADDQFTNTLVLQTKDGAPVRFAMEFTNNSGIDFQGINGTVFNGTKFYLVGQIKVPIDQEQDFQKRVFTKNHLTKGVITISSLKEAYTYLPDLLDPSLEVGIQLVPDWVQSTSVSVPL